MIKKKILELINVSRVFELNNKNVNILENINLDIYEGEIVAIIGRSGSGKSTLLKIISNLIDASSGEILYYGNPLKNSPHKISMVFQTFGLIPWLSVYENVILGLDQNNLHQSEIKEKVLKAISLVELGGYEEAYPKEMSGGMCQRVGFARALVGDPEILLMDEPFSALDYLTANSLKSDLLELWHNRKHSSLKSIIMVTHSIEEAIKLSDRVIVLASSPGKIIHDVKIKLKHPRDETSEAFHQIMDDLFTAMTHSLEHGALFSDRNIHNYPQQVSVVSLFHFMMRIKEISKDSLTLKRISADLKLNNERLVPILDSLILLKFIETQKQNIKLTDKAYKLLEADEERQKEIFREHLLLYVPFIKVIYDKLINNKGHSLSKEDLLSILASNFDSETSLKILGSAISWARYADLFSYDQIKNKLKLDQYLATR